eukprot:scaffold203874_cov39-Prasinocladus_malaysianus.AAC.2
MMIFGYPVRTCPKHLRFGRQIKGLLWDFTHGSTKSLGDADFMQHYTYGIPSSVTHFVDNERWARLTENDV